MTRGGEGEGGAHLLLLGDVVLEVGVGLPVVIVGHAAGAERDLEQGRTTADAERLSARLTNMDDCSW